MIRGFLGAVCFVLITDSVAQLQTGGAVLHAGRDSVVAAVSSRYGNASFLRKFFMGKNYRNTWETPVKLPVFRLSGSGFEIEKLGGGQQTKSLRLKDAQGRYWVLRSVDKNVSGAIPKRLRGTIAEKAVQDMISASYPFSALVVASLAKELGIIAPDPILFFVADDPALGEHRNIFANTVCYLERREPTPDNADTDGTETVLENLRESNDYIVLQKELLKARLLDMLVGDWDRHADQWRWGEKKSNGETIYYAIPRDRDNALFYTDGLIPAFARMTFMKHLGGFSKKSRGLKNLNGKSWLFDKTFMNELDAAAWQQAISELQHLLTDEVIEKAVAVIPPEAFALEGREIIDKLKSRRDGLMKNGMKYYAFLSENVIINGSDEDEIFEAISVDDRLQITVYRSGRNGPGDIIYRRSFEPGETVFIQMNGYRGNDRFIVDEQTRSRIRLRIFGGEGQDIYQIGGRVRSEVIDTMSHNNVVLNASYATVRMK